MQVLKTEDPRDQLQKATRYELCQLAKAYGITEVTYHDLPDQPHLEIPQIIAKLHERGVHTIKMPDRPLGDTRPFVVNSAQVELSPPAPVITAPAVEKPVSEMSMTEMRSECKRRGIKMARTDNMNTLREKLGQDAA